MRPTDAQVTYQWLTPVRDWTDPNTGALIPIYDPATHQQFMGCDGTTPNVICPDDPRLQKALDELTRILEMGGSVEALGYMKERLVAKLAERLRAIEAGERPVVGVNVYAETEPSPLVEGVGEGVATVASCGGLLLVPPTCASSPRVSQSGRSTRTARETAPACKGRLGAKRH